MNIEEEEEKPPPVFGSWKIWYSVVIGFLVFQIILYYVITQNIL